MRIILGEMTKPPEDKGRRSLVMGTAACLHSARPETWDPFEISLQVLGGHRLALLYAP